MEDDLQENTLASVSVILGLVAVFLVLLAGLIQGDALLLCVPALALGPIAAITGVVGFVQIRTSEGRQQGSGFALAGTILGVVSVLLFLVVWSYIVFFGGGFSL